MRQEYPGPISAILDSDHSRDHVLGELRLLRPLLQPGDHQRDQAREAKFGFTFATDGFLVRA